MPTPFETNAARSKKLLAESNEIIREIQNVIIQTATLIANSHELLQKSKERIPNSSVCNLRSESVGEQIPRLEVVAQFEFTEWTPDGHLGHSKFCGFREDKQAREVVREK